MFEISRINQELKLKTYGWKNSSLAKMETILENNEKNKNKVEQKEISLLVHKNVREEFGFTFTADNGGKWL